MTPSKTSSSGPGHAHDGHTALARKLFGQTTGFRDCSAHTVNELLAHGSPRRFGKGECLGRKGDPQDSLCIVLSGSLESSVNRLDGHRHLLGLVQPGVIYGLAPLLDGLGMTSDLWARTASVVFCVPGDAVRRLRVNDPMLAIALERQLAFRHRLLYERITADTTVPLESRVAGLLSTLTRLYGLPRGRGATLDMKLSQTDLADWIGVSRQRINFIVKKLQVDGLIELRYAGVTVVDSARLEHLAQG